MTTPGMMSAGRTWGLDQVREVRRKVGPCPRDVRSWLQDWLKFDHDVLATVLSLSTPESFIELARPAPAPSSITSNALIAVWRAGHIDPSTLLQDSAVVAFKTASVTEAVRARYNELVSWDARWVSLQCCGGTGTRILAGILFEGLALKLLCNGAGEDGARFEGYACMSPATDDSDSRLFVFQSRHPSLLLVAERDREVQLVADRVPILEKPWPSHHCEHGRHPDIPTSMTLPTYWDANKLTTDMTPGKCYVSTTPGDAVYDAYFVDVCAKIATLWFVQVAVSRTPSPSPDVTSKSRSVEELVKQAKRKFDAVAIKYLLIAPHHESLSVQWHMADELGEAGRSDVFVQFVHSSSVHSVADIIRPGDSTT